MYIPASNRVESKEKLTRFIQTHSFATVITHDRQTSFASHLPVLYHPEAGEHGTLMTHMARANPQWQHFANGQEVLVIFQGPHGYISPSWYEKGPAVPTWNYAVVHAYGVPSIIEGVTRLTALLDETVATYESALPEPWPNQLPDEYRDKLTEAIVGFEIPVSRLEGKFKLGQTRSETDLRGVYEALMASGDGGDQALARMMLAEGMVKVV